MNTGTTADFFRAIETHDLEALKRSNVDVSQPIDGKPVLIHLAEMYMRSDCFATCARWIRDQGGGISDQALEAVLCEDIDTLGTLAGTSPETLRTARTLRCAYTSLRGVSLLHIAAEFGLVESGRILIEAGIDKNITASKTEEGLNGQTPIFHTVNSNHNHGRAFLEMLLQKGADTHLQLGGVLWGEGFPWETVLFDQTLLSYTQSGLLPQFHRDEAAVYENIRMICQAQDRPIPPLNNVPNAYLAEA